MVPSIRLSDAFQALKSAGYEIEEQVSGDCQHEETLRLSHRLGYEAFLRLTIEDESFDFESDAEADVVRMALELMEDD